MVTHQRPPKLHIIFALPRLYGRPDLATCLGRHASLLAHHSTYPAHSAIPNSANFGSYPELQLQLQL